MHEARERSRTTKKKKKNAFILFVSIVMIGCFAAITSFVVSSLPRSASNTKSIPTTTAKTTEAVSRQQKNAVVVIFPNITTTDTFLALKDGDDDAAPTATTTATTTAQNLATQLLVPFQKAQAEWRRQLEHDYGTDYVSNVLWPRQGGPSLGRTLFRSPSTTTATETRNQSTASSSSSWRRLERKVLIKILRAAAATTTTTTTPQKNDNHKFLIPFVWATGGHSSAAGHGNWHNESYTAVMETNGRALLQSVGLHFQGRNRAMGGTASGPEFAACVAEILGLDADIVSWDFGQVDARRYHLMEYYFYRALRSMASPPVGIGLEITKATVKHRNAGRLQVLSSLEAMGMPVLYQDWLQDVYQAMPDTAAAANDITAMPPFLQSWRCGEQYERGEPTCADQKWSRSATRPECNERKGQSSWHPGWKWHALQGNIKVLFLMEVVTDALASLAAANEVNPKLLLAQLEQQEDADNQRMIASTELPPLAGQFFGNRSSVPADVDLSVLYQSRSYCHTARLPAQTRYLGLVIPPPSSLLDSTVTPASKLASLSATNYPVGTEVHQALLLPLHNDSLMPLAYQAGDRHVCTPDVGRDFRDYFLSSHTHAGWRHLVVPPAVVTTASNNNNNDQHGYAKDAKSGQLIHFHGLVALCLASCRKCPAAALTADDFEQGYFSLRVNDVNVTHWTPLGDDCYLLRGDHDRGHVFAPSSEGVFDVSVRIHQADKHLRISSVIVW